MIIEEASSDKANARIAEKAQPVVSVVLLAFNQQAYIEQAIAGVLAQNYPNLEIVISDDCSTDNTYGIIRRIARSYRGPHCIIVNQTTRNRGTLSHFYHAVSKSSGALIIGAAGDDVSLPDRVSTLVEEWQSTGAMAITSDWFTMDDKGINGKIGRGVNEVDVEARWFDDGHFARIAGATAAYDRRVFEAISLPDFPILCEDYFFALILNIRSLSVAHVAKPLIRYRAHAQSVANRPLANGAVLEDERRREAYDAMLVQLYEHIVSLAKSGLGVDPSFGAPAALRWRGIEAHIQYIFFRSRWIKAPLWQRLITVLQPPFTAAKLRWLLPRLGGIPTLRLQRWLVAAYRRIR